MKLKLFVVAILLVILALSIQRASRPVDINLDAVGSNEASSPAPRLEEPGAGGAPNAAVGEHATTAEARSRIAAELPLTLATQPSAPPDEDVAVIDVLAVDQQGKPLPGVNVGLSIEWVPGAADIAAARKTSTPVTAPWSVTGRKSGMSGPGLRFQPYGGSVETEFDGLVQFRIEGAAQVLSPVQLRLSSKELTGRATLEPPLVSKRVTVVLQPFARVEVTLLDASGHPIEGGFIDVKSIDAFAWSSSGNGFKKSDGRGLAVFDQLDDGGFEFSSLDKRSGTALRETIRVELGQRYQIQLRCTPRQLPVCVAGIVFDESGNPLPKVQVRVSIDGGAQTSVFSDEQGRFVQFLREGREVELTLGGGMWDDEYEPSSLRVPFGTADLRIHRKRVIEVISVRFDCLDATSGEPIRAQRLTGARYRAGRPEERSQFTFNAKGQTSLLFRDHPDWRVNIVAHGYERQDVSLAEQLQRGADENRLVLRFQRAPDFAKYEALDR